MRPLNRSVGVGPQGVAKKGIRIWVVPLSQDCYQPDVTQFPSGTPPRRGPKYWPNPGGRKQRRRQSASRQPASPQEGGGGGGVRGRGPSPREEAQCWPRPLMPSLVPSSSLSPAGPTETPPHGRWYLLGPAGALLAADSKEPRWDQPPYSHPAPAAAIRFEPAERGGAQGHGPSRPRPLAASPLVGAPPNPSGPPNHEVPSLFELESMALPGVPSVERCLDGTWAGCGPGLV